MEETINMKDFRFISSVGSIYKLITEALVRRMTKEMDKVVEESQHAFVDGRQIMDTALVVNKVVDDLFYHKREGVLCKHGEGL